MFSDEASVQGAAALGAFDGCVMQGDWHIPLLRVL